MCSMTMENLDNHESLPGEFEFSLVFSALKAKFAGAVEEQKNVLPYRMFTMDRVKEAQDQLARFRLVAPDLVDNLQLAAQTPGAVIDVGLPVVASDITEPVLISDTPFVTEQPDYFVLYEANRVVRVDAGHMQSEILDVDPSFMARALEAEPVPMSKPKETEV